MERFALSPPSSEGGLSIIEQVGRMQAQSSCGKASRCYLVGVLPDGGGMGFFRPDCKCWNCAGCAAKLRARWTLRSYLGVQAYQARGEHFQFVTLTSHEKLMGLSQTLHVWPKAWSKLRRRVQRAAPSWHFILVPEQHQDGRLHVHLIASANLGTRWWKNNARASGLGYKAEDAEFKAWDGDPALAAWYVAKYMDKQMLITAWPRKFHRIRTSQHFPELPPLPDGGFPELRWQRIAAGEFPIWAANLVETGVRLVNLSTGEALV